MKAKSTRALAFLAVIIFTCLTQMTVRRSLAQQPNSQPRTAGNVFKNIKVLRDMPASQLQSTMS
ncbi:MAG TPA: hypothetical protein VF074_12465, partial [Pyrinomonadaceae bacterium]